MDLSPGVFVLMFLGLVGSAVVTEPSLKNATDVASTMSIRDVEKNVEDLINSISKMVLPYVVQNSDLKMSGQCMSTIIKMFAHAKKLKLPTIQLLDAMGKPPFGLLRGTFAAMGDYDECLEVSANKKGDVAKTREEEVYHGKYCTIEIQLPPAFQESVREFGLGRRNITELGKLGKFVENIPANFAEYFSYDAGLCIPSTCTSSDIEEVLKINPVSFLPMKLKRCEDGRNKTVTVEQIIILCVFGVIGALVVAGTVYEGITYICPDMNKSKEKNRYCGLVLAFSMYRNTQKFLSSAKDTDYEISCVNGMYVMGTFLVVIYHTYFLPFFTFFSKTAANLGYFLEAPEFTLISTMGISIEAYFLFSGMFLVYGRFKRGGDNVQVNVTKLLLRRYLRLCPSMLLILGIILVLPIFGSGPVWGDIFQVAADNTKKYWYSYVLMYNNFLDIKHLNFLYLWFIPCLLQITIIGSILLWTLSKHRKLGILLIIATALACNTTLGILTAIKKYPPSYAIYFFHNREKYEQVIYTSPLSHVTSFNVGMLLGYYLSQRSHVRWSRIQVVLGWILTFTMTVGIQMVLYTYHKGLDVNPAVSAIYASTHKTIFSLGLAWLIIGCTHGYGGVLSKILSWKAFGPLSKLGYLAYLIHYVVIAFHVACIRTPLDFTHMEIWYRISGYIAFTFIFAYLLYVTIEVPLEYLESLMFPRKPNVAKAAMQPPKVKDHDNNQFTPGCNDYRKNNFRNNIQAMPQNVIFQSNEQSKL